MVCPARNYCKIASAAEPQKSESNEGQTWTDRVTKVLEDSAHRAKSKKGPRIDTYRPRVDYIGFLRNTSWHNKEPKTKTTATTERGITLDTDSEAVDNGFDKKPRNVFWKKRLLLMGFSGTKYSGMQYNRDCATIEDCLFRAMLQNEWITEDNMQRPFTIEFQRGSRTDRGVSAARQCCSLLLRECNSHSIVLLSHFHIYSPFFITIHAAKELDIDALNRALPDDIRVFGAQRVTAKFDARFNCDARTYSYTLPTIAFSQYNDLTSMADYRLPADRLLKVNQVLASFVGNTNFHNYTVDKEHFDRSSTRRIHSIDCSEPFIRDGVEFARITVKGQSFMMHQIRKMMAFSLAVIREIIPGELMQRSLTKEQFNVPTAPGLGLVLESLHFNNYNRVHGRVHGKLEWDKYETDVEQFRRKHIDPVIIRTEIEEESMVNWLDYLVNHSYDVDRSIANETYDDSWGEDPEFWKRVQE